MDIICEIPPYQDHFICSDDRIVALIAAKGLGKTWSGARFICQQIATQPKSQGIIMMNSRQQAEDIFVQNIEPLLEQLGWKYEMNFQKLNFKVFGSVIHIRSADPEAVKKIESIEYSWGWADEASYFPSETLRTFVSRIRKGKAIVRITSMPDEPDAYIYQFIEKLIEQEGGKLYELGLMDNPDVEFRNRYIRFLKSIYEGAQLERFLYGKRVSLSGDGLFAVDPSQKGDYPYNPNDEMMISWDFNVEYRAVSAWQQIGYDERGYPKIACVKSWKLKNATVYEDAEWLSDELKSHNNVILIHGDASGESRTAQATDSMWKTIRDTFDRKNINYHYIVPRSNPLVKDTIQCMNWALREGLIVFDEGERDVYTSLQAMKSDKYGEIDKSIDYRSDTGARSHPADTARYACYHYFKHLYPGNKGGFFVA
jgi:hypothetical protein